MPKKKTKKAVAKRIKKTGKGKLRRKKANTNHLKTKKSSKRKRKLRKDTEVDKAYRSTMKKLL